MKEAEQQYQFKGACLGEGLRGAGCATSRGAHLAGVCVPGVYDNGRQAASKVSRLRKDPLPNTNANGTRVSAAFADSADNHDRLMSQASAEHRDYVMQQIGAELCVLRPAFVAIVGQLQRAIYRAMEANGFWDGDQRNFAAKTALIHSELSEALEANRKGIEQDDKVPQYTGEEAEFADAFIRMADSAEGFSMRFADAIIDKMLYNLSRPYKHSKAY